MALCYNFSGDYMKLIVCLSENGGMSFGSKRQSRDKIQVEQMLKLVGENRLFITDYSAALFETLPSNVLVSNTPFKSARIGDYCFVENLEIPNLQFEEIVLYKWNRAYPATQFFSLNLIKNKTLVSQKEFVGNSHPNICEEVYK